MHAISINSGRAMKPGEKIRTLLSRRWRPSYSQLGEDMIISRLVDKPTGYFVDVGCYHPSLYSNTFYFYNRGWRGLNIDISEKKIGLFRKERPADTSIVCAVSDTCGTATAYMFQQGSAIDTLDRDAAEHQSKRMNTPFETIKVPVKTLSQILDEQKAPDEIDFIDIDVEGHEEQVLRGLDLSRHRPRAFILERFTVDVARAAEDPVVGGLLAEGYTIASWFSGAFILTDNRR